MKIIFLAYRNWAIEVYLSIKKHPKVSICTLAKTKNELLKLDLKYFDLLITCGWSEELGEVITDKINAIGVHCAELDRYSYGTPLQLQIMDGIMLTKHRIFSFTSDSSSKRAHTHNRLYSHEVPLCLNGSMNDILFQMKATSVALFNMFLNDYPNIKWFEWPAEKQKRIKRKPEDSRLTKEHFLKMNTQELYNFFRCLEDPYPNGYIEDEKGYLFINKVKYKEK